jgi:hypothetical protein
MSKYYVLCGENRTIIIIDYVSPPRWDYIDNPLVLFGRKKGVCQNLEDPPRQNF